VTRTDKQRPGQRPQASETAIREMHDRASAAAHRAAQHDTNAIRIVGEAEAGAEQMRRDAEQRHNDHVEHARKMAADMIAAAEAEQARVVAAARAQAAQRIAQAEAEAEAERGRILADADENLRQAHKVAQQQRDQQTAEQQDRDYWTSLASSEAAHANLPAVPPTAPFGTVPDGQLDASGARDA
jgi:colicin import membrane protein